MTDVAKSIYAGKPLYDMRNMICSPDMARKFARLKTTGFLTGAATKSNRWGIARVDINASSCLQSSPCQHVASFWLTNGGIAPAFTSCAAQLYTVSVLIGVEFDKKGKAHLAGYAERSEAQRAEVEKALDEQFGLVEKKTSSEKPVAEKKKKRSAPDATAAPKKRSVKAEKSEK